MKKILTIVLIVFCLFFICSCQEKPSSDGSNNNGGTLSEGEQIKETVLALMNQSEKQQDPSTLFSYFDGDYEISNFTSSGEGIQSIKRKNAVSLVTASGMKYYGVEAAGMLFYAADVDGRAEVIGIVPLQADMSEKSTIFTAFGIDTGAVYGVEAEDDVIELTKDMLTVSEDNKTCTFSKAYIDEMAKMICESMGYSKTQTDRFLEKYTGSGVYSVSENKITFEIKCKDTTLGNVHQITRYSEDDDQKVNVYSYMEYSNPSLGIKKPVIVEIDYKDVVYSDSLPVSATIVVKTSSESGYYDGNYQGAPYITVNSTIKTTFTLDCSDGDNPKGIAAQETTRKESYQGESWTNKTTLNLSVDLGKSSSQFVFSEKRDGDTITSLKANKVTFSTPTSFPAVPQRITDTITNYINKNF